MKESSRNFGIDSLRGSQTRLFAELRMSTEGARSYQHAPSCCSLEDLLDSTFAQQDQRIDRQRALRGDPRSQQAEQQHGQHGTGHDKWVARRGLIHNVSQHLRRNQTQNQAKP